MNGKQRLQGRGAGKGLFKLPNLIEVEAGRRIPESEQKITNKTVCAKLAILTPLPADWVNGPPVEVTFQS